MTLPPTNDLSPIHLISSILARQRGGIFLVGDTYHQSPLPLPLCTFSSFLFPSLPLFFIVNR